MLKIIGRIVVTLTGFALAVAMAVVVLFTLGTLWVADATATPAGDDIERLFNHLSQAYGTLLFIASVAPTLTILPGLIVAVAGELGHIRALLYYVTAGGLAVASLPLMSAGLTPVDPSAASLLPTPTYLAIFATAGFAAGFTYWLIAGRTA